MVNAVIVVLDLQSLLFVFTVSHGGRRLPGRLPGSPPR